MRNRCTVLDFPPNFNKIVKTKQIAVFVVSFYPLCQMSYRYAFGKRCGLSKVDHVDRGQPTGIVHEEK